MPAGTGTVSVYASWNGATEVSRWEALAGSGPTTLQPVGAADRTGFETTITARTSAPYVAARALDASGTVLATSQPIKV